MYQTLIEAICENAKKEPGKLAIGFKEYRITYEELVKKMIHMASVLQSNYEVQRKDRVMLSAVSKPEYVVALLAIQYLGAVSVPVDKTGKETGIVELYNFIQPKLILTDQKIQNQNVNKVSLKQIYAMADGNTENETACSAYVLPNKEETAEILFTTGTTGQPKGGMLTYRSIYASIHNTRDGIGMKDTDIILLPLPLNHSVGMRVLRTTLYIGASVVLQNGFTFAKELEKNIDTYGCTGLISVPASLEVVYRQMQDDFATVMGKLRYIEIGAGALSIEMRKKLPELLPHTEIHNTWGSTETGGAIFMNLSKRKDKVASLGKPVHGVEVKIVDEEGNEIVQSDAQNAGRMILRGDMQMAGYYHAPELTKQAIVNGWLYTNDCAYKDEEGFIYMLGRLDDIINVGGEKVSPLEIENIALEYPQIRECVCVGVADPDGVLGYVPVLYIVPEGQMPDEKELIRFLAGKMEKYKLPHYYRYIEEIPRNNMKKIDRKVLRKMWNDTGSKEKILNDVIVALKDRRSIREFSDKKLSKEQLEVIVKSGIYAPCAQNLQTWKFTVIQNEEQIERIKLTLYNVAKEKNVHCFGFVNPKALILISNDRRNANYIQDSACAAQNMMLAAHSLGIGSVWLNAIYALSDCEEIRNILREWGIPEQHVVVTMLGMGYPIKEAVMPAKKQNVIHWID